MRAAVLSSITTAPGYAANDSNSCFQCLSKSITAKRVFPTKWLLLLQNANHPPGNHFNCSPQPSVHGSNLSGIELLSAKIAYLYLAFPCQPFEGCIPFLGPQWNYSHPSLSVHWIKCKAPFSNPFDSRVIYHVSDYLRWRFYWWLADNSQTHLWPVAVTLHWGEPVL